MANPTTNYGFVLPTPTDLVTDLPADFDVALQGVDTRLKALQPGTTLGDLAYSSATANTNTRLAIGTSGQVLAVSGGGVPAWTTTADVTPLTTKGDLFTFSTVDARLGVGTDAQILVADSTASTGLKWATPSAAALTSQSANLAAPVTITSANTYYDGPTITLAAGTWLIVGQVTIEDGGSTGGRNTAKLWDGTTVSSSLESSAPGGASIGMTLSGIVAPTGSTTYKVSVASSQASHVIRADAPTNSAGNNASHISAVKIA